MLSSLDATMALNMSDHPSLASLHESNEYDDDCCSLTDTLNSGSIHHLVLNNSCSSIPERLDEDDDDASCEDDDASAFMAETCHTSRSSMQSSMSLFMSGLVGTHVSDDFSFALQVDNAKAAPLDAVAGTATSSTTSSGNSSNNSRKYSRWDSTPTQVPKSPKNKGRKSKSQKSKPSNNTLNSSNHSNSSKTKTHNNASPTSITETLTTSHHRPRAMRPWRPPSTMSTNSSNHSHSHGTSSGDGSHSPKKGDRPIQVPQRAGSISNLSANAKRPTRYDSNRSLMTYDRQDSMDLRVLLECDEENEGENSSGEQDNDKRNNQGFDNDSGVYVRIPHDHSIYDASGLSMWSSASTMTASFASHYSSNSHNMSSLCSSNRSLFCKSEEERPMRPPQRTNSREDPFGTNASAQSIRRPVRKPSNRNVTTSSADNTMAVEGDVAATNTTTATNDSSSNSSNLLLAAKNHRQVSQRSLLLMPTLMNTTSTSNSNNQYEDSFSSFRLLRSMSLESVWKETTGEDARSGAVRSLLKRTLSDSMLFQNSESMFFQINDEDTTASQSSS